uniref:t-SNARE coiled-coil homology domain-containing protein n=1 Tax=Heterorhabditis bacteriophora TaxID=37862 RepID=A0A1I7XVH2_HETBA
MNSVSGYRYSRLNESDVTLDPNPNVSHFEDIVFKQEQIIRDQDGDLELVGKSVRTLKEMSYKIGNELDQQSMLVSILFELGKKHFNHELKTCILLIMYFSMLDDLGQDMDRVDTKLDGVMKKIAKLTHMDDGK